MFIIQAVVPATLVFVIFIATGFFVIRAESNSSNTSAYSPLIIKFSCKKSNNPEINLKALIVTKIVVLTKIAMDF